MSDVNTKTITELFEELQSASATMTGMMLAPQTTTQNQRFDAITRYNEAEFDLGQALEARELLDE